MNKNLILAIDQGGQSSRVGLFGSDGKLLKSFSHACATYQRTHEESGIVYIEQNPKEILQGIQLGIQEISDFLKNEVTAVSTAGFSGQGSSLLCWNKLTGEPLSPVISWQDIRGESYCNQLNFSQTQIQEKTGLRNSPHYGASKMRWCLDHLEVVSQAAKSNELCIGPIVSYIFWHLLNRVFVVDVGHAQRTLLWNIHSQNWDLELLDAFQIDPSFLPECRPHDATFGSLQLGEHTVTFCASARDQGASLFAKGRPIEQSIYINMGTGAFVQTLNNSLEAPDGILVSPIFVSEHSTLQNIYAWEATVNGAASAIQWLSNEIGETVTTRLMQEALRHEPSKGSYFLNSIGGLSAPYWRTNLVPRFSPEISSREKVTVWLESIIFQIFVNIQCMHTKPIHNIYISGGLSNLDGLCQLLADLTHIKVLRHENKDASLQGAAYLAAEAKHLWKSHDSMDIFNPKTNPNVQLRFLNWQNAMHEWLNETY